jgi:MazG family protein
MENLKKLIETIETLRGEGGCAWDREQTHATLKPNMLEEAYEAVDAINSGDMKHLKEELGDVLLQVILHSQIAKEGGHFDIEDVACGINQKLIERHPHVFGDVEVKNVDNIIDNWEEIKKRQKPHRKSVLDGISKAQSALMSAQKISKKAVKAGFEWQNLEQLYECILSEFQEFVDARTQEEKEEEFGDILFALVNLARWKKLDAEQCLIKANEKFTKRFKEMESRISKPLEELTFEEWEDLWIMAKEKTKPEKTHS